MNARSQTLRNTLFSTVGIYTEFFLGMLTSILIARHLGPHDFGSYSLIIWLVAIGVAVTNSGTAGAAIRFIAELRGGGNAQLIEPLLDYLRRAQRLFLLVGKQATDNAQLSTLLAGIAKTQTDTPVAQAIATQEHAIDESGEGLFGWASLHGVGSLATGAIPPTAGTLPGDLLSKADGVAFGAGSVDGHGHMQLRFHAPQSRLLGYLASYAPVGPDGKLATSLIVRTYD